MTGRVALEQLKTGEKYPTEAFIAAMAGSYCQ